jgi:lysophospholipase L1-like esterase
MLAKSFYACLFSISLLGLSSMTQSACAQLRPELAPPEVMMLGDSITEAGPWQALFPKTRIVNRGVSGYTTYDLLREIKATVALRPAKVFLMIGINDLLRRATVEQTFKQYTLIVDELQKNKITVVMQATLECSRPQCGSAVESVRSLNQKLQAFAVARNIQWLDLNPGLANDEQGLLPKYTWDGLHLSKPAYLSWAERLKSFIQ